MDIYKSLCKKNDYALSEAAEISLSEYFEKLNDEKDANFGNGRDVRNLFEKTITNQSKRVFSIQNPTAEQLMTIEAVDIEA